MNKLIEDAYKIADKNAVILKGNIKISGDVNCLLFAHYCDSTLFYKRFFKISIDISISDYEPKSHRNVGKHCRHAKAWIPHPDCHVGFIPCERVYFYSFLFILRYGHRYFGFMCPVLGKR